MDAFGKALNYALQDQARFRAARGTHLLLVAIAIAIGILTPHSRAVSIGIINTISTFRVIPGLAILFPMLPYFGLSRTSALIALTILALPPILINTAAAFRRIDPAIREAARGMGMSAAQSSRRVEFPLALPVILAGIRTALTEVIASATLAAFIGAGSLGLSIILDFAQFNNAIPLIGAMPAPSSRSSPKSAWARSNRRGSGVALDVRPAGLVRPVVRGPGSDPVGAWGCPAGTDTRNDRSCWS